MATTAESYYGISEASRTSWSSDVKKRFGYSKLSPTDWMRRQGYDIPEGAELVSTRDVEGGVAIEGSSQPLGMRDSSRPVEERKQYDIREPSTYSEWPYSYEQLRPIYWNRPVTQATPFVTTREGVMYQEPSGELRPVVSPWGYSEASEESFTKPDVYIKENQRAMYKPTQMSQDFGLPPGTEVTHEQPPSFFEAPGEWGYHYAKPVLEEGTFEMKLHWDEPLFHPANIEATKKVAVGLGVGIPLTTARYMGIDTFVQQGPLVWGAEAAKGTVSTILNPIEFGQYTASEVRKGPIEAISLPTSIYLTSKLFNFGFGKAKAIVKTGIKTSKGAWLDASVELNKMKWEGRSFGYETMWRMRGEPTRKVVDYVQLDRGQSTLGAIMAGPKGLKTTYNVPYMTNKYGINHNLFRLAGRYKEDLMNYGELPVEVSGAITEKGLTLVHTGTESSVKQPIAKFDTIVSVTKKGKLKLDQRFTGKRTIETLGSEFVYHTHPSEFGYPKRLLIEPSPADIGTLAYSTFNDFIQGEAIGSRVGVTLLETKPITKGLKTGWLETRAVSFVKPESGLLDTRPFLERIRFDKQGPYIEQPYTFDIAELGKATLKQRTERVPFYRPEIFAEEKSYYFEKSPGGMLAVIEESTTPTKGLKSLPEALAITAFKHSKNYRLYTELQKGWTDIKSAKEASVKTMARLSADERGALTLTLTKGGAQKTRASYWQPQPKTLYQETQTPIKRSGGLTVAVFRPQTPSGITTQHYVEKWAYKPFIITAVKPGERELQDKAVVVVNVNPTRIGELFRPQQLTDTLRRTHIRQRTLQIPKLEEGWMEQTLQPQQTETMTTSETQQRYKPFTTTLQKTKTIIKTKTKTKQKIKDITPLPKPKRLLLLKGTRYPSNNLSKLFSVQVRRKGKWTPVATLPKKAATQLGIDITETTAARSFRLAPTGIEAEAKDIPFVTGMERYRKPKARSTLGFDTWVEKTKYAISTPGEKREITLKGLSMRPMRLRVIK